LKLNPSILILCQDLLSIAGFKTGWKVDFMEPVTGPVPGTSSGPRAPIVWSDTCQIGVASLDEEHRLLVGILNRIIQAIGTPNERTIADRSLRELFAYTTYHFSHEEELMALYEYPDQEQHQEQHQQFIGRLRQFDRAFVDGSIIVADLCLFLRSWLMGHIFSIDARLGAYLAPRLSPAISPQEFEPHQPPFRFHVDQIESTP
jgi:hemerythrin-like metal-binding protein